MKEVAARQFPYFLALQVAQEEVFLVKDLGLLGVSKLVEDGYSLGFIDLRKVVYIDRAPQDLEAEAAAKGVKRDVPWGGFEAEYVLTLVEFEGSVRPAVKFIVKHDEAMFNWAHIARSLLDGELEAYLTWLKNRLGVKIEALEIVGV
ncbi:MAG: hypothetical protein JZD41_01495 [Thermoproteus sp.]|nr:hypothetical protein [Thermoproteus sp.]